MIPAVGRLSIAQEETLPDKTYRIDRVRGTLGGEAQGLEAVRQAVMLILNVQRYRHAIYSWGYGVYLDDLFGQPVALVQSEIKRRITDALLADERVLAVEDFSFEPGRGRLLTRFVVRTIYGEVQEQKEVAI